MRLAPTSVILVLPSLLGACVHIEPLPADPYAAGQLEAQPAEWSEPQFEVGDEIVVCGERFATGAPVVLWTDPGGYDGYAVGLVTGTNPKFRDKVSGRRYRPGRSAQLERGVDLVPGHSERALDLVGAVDQFVLHFDVCGLSRTCFDVLHHQRGLSVHFLLDIDGTIYQTLDLRETAWHATKANSRSIGIEIAHIGSRTPDQLEVFQEWYSIDELGPYIDIPERFGDGGVRTEAFHGRPARSNLIEGRINGTRLLQYDFTPEQYESLVRLTKTLSEAIPSMGLRVPRDESGAIPTGKLDDEEFEHFSGVLAHYHVQANKIDPGPAFDWERLLREIRMLQHVEASLEVAESLRP